MTRRRVIAAIALALVLTACGAPKNGRPTFGARRTTTTADDRTFTDTSTDPSVPVSITPDRGPDFVGVAPGTYAYTQTGTNHGTGTLKGVPFDQTKPINKSWYVTYRKPAGPGGRVQHLEATTGAEIVAEDLSYRSGIAANITSLRYSDGGGVRDFAPNPAARFVPIPLTVGATWRWTMTSRPDSSGEVVERDGTFRAVRSETVLVDRVKVNCVVIEATITLDRPLAKTIHMTSWYAESLKLVVREHQLVDYRVQGEGTDLAFHIDQTALLGSTKPS